MLGFWLLRTQLCMQTTLPRDGFYMNRILRSAKWKTVHTKPRSVKKALNLTCKPETELQTPIFTVLFIVRVGIKINSSKLKYRA